ncbi:hypothetical protein E2C01_077948 [Portunus trituberculatus]|uniref:Uncharacterized protein n=1 Tax=Portunus trituberculatus TaxID=210409 RepID=A0A5B7ILE5_PORTR|nr:hypothetical protein [Portunus trituberculatus]
MTRPVDHKDNERWQNMEMEKEELRDWILEGLDIGQKNTLVLEVLNLMTVLRGTREEDRGRSTHTIGTTAKTRLLTMPPACRRMTAISK